MRSEADKLAGVIPVNWSDGKHGTVRRVPTLKRKASREWKDLLLSKVGDVSKLDVSGMDSIGAAVNVGTDIVAELVVAYDASGVLGGPEFIEDNIDDSQLYDALKAFLQVSFPFVSDLRSALTDLQAVVGQPSLNSTSSPSQSGASTRKGSTTG